MFSEERVTQMAAYFLIKSGFQIAHIKLLKLLYLAERKAMAKWGCSMSGDRFVSMPHGPVMSQTYDLIKGHSPEQSFWNKWIKGEKNYEVSLDGSVNIEYLDELSRSEMKILDDTYTEFGSMDRFQLVDYTHQHCHEWVDPNGSSYPIKPESVMRAVGQSEEQVSALLIKHKEDMQLDLIRASLK